MAQYILVINDDASTRKKLAQQLRAEGFIVEESGNLSDGLGMVGSRRFDLVIAELFTPGVKVGDVDRVAFFRSLSRMRRPPRLVVLTAEPNLKNAIEAKQGGADGFVEQPYSFYDLLTEIRFLLAR